MKIYNPATGKVITTLEADNVKTIKSKLAKIHVQNNAWQQLALDERIAIIDTFKTNLLESKDALTNDLTLETGKPIKESLAEIEGACYRIDYFTAHAKEVLKEEYFNQNTNTQEKLSYEPLGAIANISAWNYPFLVGVNVFIPALITGNHVAYKPSEFASLTGLNIQASLYQSGVPESAFQTFIGGKEVGEALLSEDLDGYFFTGSYHTGRFIAEKVAYKLVPVGLELGGKDPAYVSEFNSDINKVASSLVEGAFYNNGQSCCAVERIYVHTKHYQAFCQAFVDHSKGLIVGNPMDKLVTNGAITRPQHLAFLQDQVEDACQKGAKLLTGGNIIPSEGNFFEPTVLSNVNHSMKVMYEESFGPIIGIQEVKDEHQALTLMNDTQYGLTASIFSDNEEEAKHFMHQLDAGNVYMNCADRVSPFLPWAGRKRSGLGATLSKHGLYAFCKTKGWHFRKA